MQTESILKKIGQQIEAGLYPGASLALYQEGAWQEFYLGFSDPDQQAVTGPGLIYDLASVSKVLGVGTILAQDYKAGQLDLDQPFCQLYPAIKDQEVTVRELLTHTSGLDPFIPNRDSLNAQELKAALEQLDKREEKTFLYSDVNFLLLGFYLEERYGISLDQLFEERIFSLWDMKETSFGPRPGAVPTLERQNDGQVHDPKARVLGRHAGSAGLFSSLRDLERYCQRLLEDDWASDLTHNYNQVDAKTRSLGWNLEGDWLDHTGYTGTFIMLKQETKEAAIFLSNRTYWEDDRTYWIEKRNQLMEIIRSDAR